MPDLGDLLRLRNFRTYGTDGRSYTEWVCGSLDETGNKKRQKREDKEVFLAVLIGYEKLVGGMTQEETYTYVRTVMRGLGFVSVEELRDAGVDIEQFGFEEKKNGKRKNASGRRNTAGEAPRTKTRGQRRRAEPRGTTESAGRSRRRRS